MEKDYIKRETLIDILNAKADMALGTPKQVFLSVAKMVELLPTADVVEVRHGKWKKVYDKAPRYVCTACNHLFNNKEYKYCPNCGAKMEKGKSNERDFV